MVDFSWMAWTWQTATFFLIIVSLLVIMTVMSHLKPSPERKGILGIETTRGDRLFISLLGSAFICLFWLLLFGSPLWWSLGVCLLYTLAVFRWV